MQIYKKLNYLELDTKKLSGNDEYDDLFFKKLDEIDNIISDGNNLNFIIEKFNIEKSKFLNLDKFGNDENSIKITNLDKTLLKKVFNIKEFEPTVLIEHENKFYVFELIKTEKVQKKINDQEVEKKIVSELKREIKKKLIAEIVSKTNNNTFGKNEFNKLSLEKNVPIQKIRLENLSDYKILKKEVVNEIYGFPEKKIVAIYDINFDNNFLIYIDKIENVFIDKNSEEYENYTRLAKFKITKRLYNTYDDYLKMKYKISINYKALDEAKNYFIN